MKRTFLPWIALACVLSMGLSVLAWADDDERVIGKFDHNGPHDPLSVASVYLTLKSDKAEGLPGVPSGDETRFYQKVWEGLYLQVTTETTENGTEGYMFAFSNDEAGQSILKPQEDVKKPTLRELAAADFRTDDNFAPKPLRPGPGIPSDRSAFRVVQYPGFEAEIRVLEFSIGDTGLGKKPHFNSVSCLVTVKEVKGNKKK